MVATVRDLNWNPMGPAWWIDPEGVEFDLEAGDRDRLLDFELLGALNQGAWEQAARHHLGHGLGQGPDLTILRRHLARLRRHQLHGEAAILQMVATGGLWTASRRFGSEAAKATGAPEAEQAPQALAGASSGHLDAAEADIDFDAEAEYNQQQEEYSHLHGHNQLQDSHNYLQYEFDCFECEDPVMGSFTTSGKPVWSTALCPRCQTAEETTFHKLWECPANLEIPGTHMEFLPEAQEGHKDLPCFWLCGLPPLRWTYDPCMQPVRGDTKFQGCSPTSP